MKIEQAQLDASGNWAPQNPGTLNSSADLVFLFGGRDILKDSDRLDKIKTAYPSAIFMGCSTAGEICGTHVCDDTLALTAINFENTQVKSNHINIHDCSDSYEAGRKLAEALPKESLVHAFVISDGLNVNGSDLVKGITDHLPQGVTVTGGLSGDGANFKETVIMCDDHIRADSVSIIGFYGSQIKVGYGSLGGWDTFGTERLITRSSGNVLYDLDGQSALELYKEYLGKHADGLPATGLLFPLAVRVPGSDYSVVRTILGVDEAEQSMTFAGDVPEGSYAKLMKANFTRLVDGALGAAETSHKAIASSPAELAILVSCVGRKMVLKQRVEEEVEAVRDVLGNDAVLTGFYSYGEISPFTPNAKCELHNQTMTITTFSEH